MTERTEETANVKLGAAFRQIDHFSVTLSLDESEYRFDFEPLVGESYVASKLTRCTSERSDYVEPLVGES